MVYVFDEGFKDVILFGKDPNAEELISSDVDLAIIKDAEYAEELRKQGINAVCFKYKNKDELYSAVNMLGDIFGEDAQTYAAKWDNKLDETIAKIADAYKVRFCSSHSWNHINTKAATSLK